MVYGTVLMTTLIGIVLMGDEEWFRILLLSIDRFEQYQNIQDTDDTI